MFKSIYDRLNTEGKHFFYDQAIFSLSNFLILFVLAKTMTKADFGTLILLITLLTFLYGLNGSIIHAPVMALYHQVKDKKSYVSSLFILNLTIVILAVPSIFVFYLIYKDLNLDLQTMLIFFGVALSYISYEFSRRLHMLELKTHRLIIADTVSCFLRFLIILWLAHSFSLNLNEVLLIFVSMFIVGTFILWTRLKMPRLGEIKGSFQRNFVFGKWKLFQHFLVFLSDPVYIFLTGIILGPRLLGIYAAIEIITRFANLLIFSSNNYSMSVGTKILHTKGYQSFFRAIKSIYLKGFYVLLAGIIFLLVFGKQMLSIIYDTEVASYYLLLPLLLVRVLIRFASQPLLTIFNALEKPQVAFYAYLISTGITLMIIYPLIANFGIFGISVGHIITSSTLLLVLYITFKKKKNMKDNIIRT